MKSRPSAHPSSSVCGPNTAMPFSVSQTSTVRSAFAAPPGKANELMAYAYAAICSSTDHGLRFFTVYGPRAGRTWRRGCKLFKQAVRSFNRGDMKRFTDVDDVSPSDVKLDHVPQGNAAWSGDDPDPATSRGPWRV
jgi:UDP-glucuronate 4-epimerase